MFNMDPQLLDQLEQIQKNMRTVKTPHSIETDRYTHTCPFAYKHNDIFTCAESFTDIDTAYICVCLCACMYYIYIAK